VRILRQDEHDKALAGLPMSPSSLSAGRPTRTKAMLQEIDKRWIMAPMRNIDGPSPSEGSSTDLDPPKLDMFRVTAKLRIVISMPASPTPRASAGTLNVVLWSAD
jgi:hypothetical protein